MENKKQQDIMWHTPKQIQLPKEINNYLLQILKCHTKETTDNFYDELVKTERITEQYWSVVEAIIWDYDVNSDDDFMTSFGFFA